jgi:hypothetical protein
MRPETVLLPFLALTTLAALPRETDTRLFHLDAKGAVTGPARHVGSWLSLNLASVTVDQPEYWPNERVALRVLVPGRPKLGLTATVQKRDATPTRVPLTLDEDGVAVVSILDGEKTKLELGEYRVDVASRDGKTKGSATFAVVEGQLGGVSFAHEWHDVTRAADLDTIRGGWFLGNAQGAGSRWGNGLSFRNELRVDNEPFTGDVEAVPHCMLPGCGGIAAGPPQHLHVHQGDLRGTLEVGGHSGPFQLEVVSPYGTLRHQFAHSGHVERELIPVSGGMGTNFEVGLAPYEGLEPIPGRSLYVHANPHPEENAHAVFHLASIATREAAITVDRKVDGARAYVWTAQGNGTFKAEERPIASTLAAGSVVRIAGAGPMSVVTIGGRVGGRFEEGWAMLFPPAALRAEIDVPKLAEPMREASLVVHLSDQAGTPIEGSGILEVFDSRVAPAAPEDAIASALGDGIRNGSSDMTSWVSPEETARLRRDRDYVLEEAAKRMAPFGGAAFSYDGSSGIAAEAPKGRAASLITRPPAQAVAVGEGPDKSVLAARSDDVRRGEKKVVFAGRVRTASDGSATVRMTMPPQAGRLVARFTAAHGLDWAKAQAGFDVTRKANVEARLPRMVVPGALLEVRAVVRNGTESPLTFEARGAGLAEPIRATAAVGASELLVPWRAASGDVTFELRNAAGFVVDRRVHTPQLLGDQRVTFSRIVFGDAKAAPGETARTFSGPRELLRGVTTNFVTTMRSWYPHAEALSARLAAEAVLLAAIDEGILDDEGLRPNLRASFAADTAAFRESAFDASSGLVRPWPGMPTSLTWSRWASRNLHAALAHVKDKNLVSPSIVEALANTLTRLDAAIARAPGEPSFGDGDPARDGEDVVPIEVDGKVVWRVVTDGAVQRFVIDQLAPLLDPKAADMELACSKAYDRFRFLRAFSRTARTQLLLEQAKAALAAGPRGKQAFRRLYETAARDLLLTQDPGILQGPSLLGGVYSAPMAMVRFLELTLLLPATPITRIDRPGIVRFSSDSQANWVTARVSESEIPMAGGKATLVVELDPSKDPSDYYAIVAVPSTLGIAQTEDILADYRGNLIYGQQAGGASKPQLMAIPFRGLSRLSLLLEAVQPGTSPGFVAVRHIERPDEEAIVAIPEVRVRTLAAHD